MPSKVERREQLFVEEYLIDLNGSRAARAAGYKGSDQVIGVTATRLLKKPKIAAAIQAAMDERVKRTQFNADRVLKEIEYLATVDIGKAYDEKGQLLPIKDIPEEVRRAIAGVEVFEEFEGFGKDRIQIGETKKMKTYDKNKALELAGRHFKMYTDKVEHSGTVELASNLAKARARAKGNK